MVDISKLKFIIIILCLVLSGNLYSREKNYSFLKAAEDTTYNKNSLENGKWALQFGISDNLTLSNFNGATLSVKRQLSDKSALRLSFKGNYKWVGYDNFNFYVYEYLLFTADLLYMYYLNPSDLINIYGYAGAGYSREYLYDNGYIRDGYRNTFEYSIGPSIGAGAEYFVFKSMSVFAEYNFDFRFGKKDFYENGIISSANPIYKTLNINEFIYDNVKFGLSVYF